MRPRALLPAATLLAAITLATTSCQSSTTGGQSGSGGGSQASRTLRFATPTAGATVTSPVAFTVTVTGAQIGQPETGKLHLHLYVDDSSQYKIVYATHGSVDVPAGLHTLKAVLAQPNHSETSVTATEQVDVAAGGGQAPATTSKGGYGYP